MWRGNYNLVCTINNDAARGQRHLAPLAAGLRRRLLPRVGGLRGGRRVDDLGNDRP
jgi:hypothetical protein